MNLYGLLLSAAQVSLVFTCRYPHTHRRTDSRGGTAPVIWGTGRRFDVNGVAGRLRGDFANWKLCWQACRLASEEKAHCWPADRTCQIELTETADRLKLLRVRSVL